jgi:hypothetical protein
MALVIVFLLIKPPYVHLPVGGGARAWVEMPGVVHVFGDCTYKLSFISEAGKRGEVCFRGNFFDGQPLLFLCPSNSSFMLCLYGGDASLRLLRIDTDQGFGTLPANTSLGWIVSNSSYCVRAASREEWEQLFVYFQDGAKVNANDKWLPMVSFGFGGIYPSRQGISSDFRSQFEVMFGPGPRWEGSTDFYRN